VYQGDASSSVSCAVSTSLKHDRTVTCTGKETIEENGCKLPLSSLLASLDVIGQNKIDVFKFGFNEGKI
jgi:hypothetical protein